MQSDAIISDYRPISRARNNLQNRLQSAAGDVASIGRKLEAIDPFATEARSINLLSDSPQAESPDSHEHQDFLDRYLSDGEVLSQGEFQLGLSEDFEPDYDDSI